MTMDLDQAFSTLDQQQQDQPGDLDKAFAALDQPDASSPSSSPTDASVPWYKSLGQGLTDNLYGAANRVLHASPTVSSAASPFEAMEVKQSDDALRKREQDYQASRGRDGGNFDWWRFAGNVASPVNLLVPEAAGSGAFVRGAVQSVPYAMSSPVLDNNFKRGAALQTGGDILGGGAFGMLGGWLSSKLSPYINDAIQHIHAKFGGNVPDHVASSVADQTLTESLGAKGVSVNEVDPAVLNTLRDKIKTATETGSKINEQSVFNQAEAASLPVPVHLTEGQASRDPIQFSREMNIRGVQGLGEDMTNHLAQQNRDLIENLNVMGARNAPTQIDTASRVINAIKTMDENLKGKIDEAYSAVRNSAGRPALMDHVAFVKSANDALDHGQLGPFLPSGIRNQLNDIASGKLPLSVNTAQQLDKIWSAEQRGASGSSGMAIGALRDALNNAPVNDSVGQDAMKAYQAARTMAKQRFDLIDNHPAYSAILDGKPSAEPESFFQKFLQGGTAKDVGNLVNLSSKVDPEIPAQVRSATLGMVKNRVLNGANDENGIFSESKINDLLSDPVKRARLSAVLDPQTMKNLDRLGRVSSNVLKFPKAATVNTSNTGSTVVNLARDLGKSTAWRLASKVTLGAAEPVKEAIERRRAMGLVRDMLNPSVTTGNANAATQEVPLSSILRALAVPAINSGLTESH